MKHKSKSRKDIFIFDIIKKKSKFSNKRKLKFLLKISKKQAYLDTKDQKITAFLRKKIAGKKNDTKIQTLRLSTRYNDDCSLIKYRILN